MNGYASVGYGSSMKYTNMIVWQSFYSDTTADDQIDVYSTVDHMPIT